MSAGAPAYRIDGALADAASFYRVACDPRRSVVVEACAGAGKTWMLVSRMLRALLDGAEPQQILAITFTRKAAGEMRERLHGWLHAYAHAAEPDRLQALRERGCSAAEAQALAPRLAVLYEHLLDGGRPVEIRTFHGWFSQLLRAAPMAARAAIGLHGEVELLEDRSDLQPQYWRRFLRAVDADAALRADFAALVQAHGRHTTQTWLEAALDQRIEIARADAAGVLEASVPSAAATFPAFAGLATPAAALREPALRDALWTLAATLGASAKAKPAEAAAGIEAALSQSDDAAALRGLQKALFTDKGEPRKLGDPPGQAAACAHLQRIAEADAQQTAHLTHLRLVRLARVLLASYQALKRDRGLADMADLESAAEQLLSDAGLAGWIHQRLDQQLRHLLIDEFQDTSPLQWRALAAWLAGYAGAGGGASGQRPLAVFIVGDPKQSIYRFRRADPRVFAQAADFVVQALDGARLACGHTRRNAPAVLAVLNAVFDQAQAAQQFDGFRPHTTGVAAPAGEVLLLPVQQRPARLDDDPADAAAPAGWRDSLTTPRTEPEEALRMAEARQVAAQIARRIADGHAPGEIHVLCRKRAPLALVAQALRERAVPHVAPEQRALMDAPEVQDLVALLDVLASPGHDLALARVLRSPLFGAADDDLVAVAAAAERRPGRWWSALHAGAGAARPALDRARAWLPRWAAAARALPPHDLLDRVLADGDVLARYAAAEPPSERTRALAAIDALVAQVLLLGGGRNATPYGVVRRLRRERVLLPPQAHADAVQLMTIHGAKGLEAQTVVLIDSDPEPPKAEHAGLLIDWPADAAHPACCAFIASEARCPPSLAGLLAAERAGRRREELNALYVAMTRARQTLVLSATAPFRPAPEPGAWQRLAAAGATRLAVTPSEPPMPALGTAAPAVVLRALPQLPARPEPPAAAPPDSESARLGRAVHRVLEWLPPADDAAALAAASRAACAEFGLWQADAPARAEALARTVLTSPACRPFFEPAGLHWAGNEVALAWQGALWRIDRLVAVDGPRGRVWWVLDYKLQHAPEAIAAYREQLGRYRDAVRALRPGEEVQAAFVTAAGAVIVL